MKYAARFFFLALVFGLVGCGSNPPERFGVTGNILFNGEPLVDGTIQFMPMYQGKQTGALAVVKDGKYEVPQHQGLRPGKYRIILSSPDDSQVRVEYVGPDNFKHQVGVSQERIPPGYNVESTQEVEVRAETNNVFDFDIR